MLNNGSEYLVQFETHSNKTWSEEAHLPEERGGVVIPSPKSSTVILQIFGALKFRWRAIAERSVSF